MFIYSLLFKKIKKKQTIKPSCPYNGLTLPPIHTMLWNFTLKSSIWVGLTPSHSWHDAWSYTMPYNICDPYVFFLPATKYIINIYQYERTPSKCDSDLFLNQTIMPFFKPMFFHVAMNLVKHFIFSCRPNEPKWWINNTKNYFLMNCNS